MFCIDNRLALHDERRQGAVESDSIGRGLI